MVAALACVAAAVPVAAQAQREDQQLWLQANTNVPIAEGLRLTVEQIARFGHDTGGLFQTEFGGILGYKLAKNVEFGFGYRHVGAHNGNTADDENRLRQHVIMTFGRVFTRFRLDERFHPDGDEIGFRIRPLLRYNHPLGRGYALFVSHESFYLANSTRWGQRRGYDRMRNIVGVTVPIAKRFSADIGYLNQYRLGRGGARAQMDHALNLQLTIDLSRKHAAPAPSADD